jgi:hypothetical protein
MELNNTNTSPLANNQPTKFNESEIAELTEIRQAYDQTTLALGQLELQKREVKKNETKIEQQLIAVEAQEKVFLDKIVAKYGEGSFDISTGLFTPKKL